MVEGTIHLMGWKVQIKRLGWKQDFSKQPFYVIFTLRINIWHIKNKIIKKFIITNVNKFNQVNLPRCLIVDVTHWLHKMLFLKYHG